MTTTSAPTATAHRKASVTSELIEFASTTPRDAVPTEVLEQARRVVYDTVTCMIAANSNPAAAMCDEAIGSLGGNAEARMIPSGSMAPFPGAAFANANRAKLLDFDENLLYHSHMANVVVASALAAGEARDRTVDEVMHAVVVGFEIAARVSLSVRVPKLSESGKIVFPYWSTFSYNTLGGSVAVSLLLDLSTAQMANAFGIAAVGAPLPTLSRAATAPYWPTLKYGSYGVQAFVSCMSAVLAKLGVTGDPAILDGHDNFWRLCGAPEEEYDPSSITEGLGDRWWITETSFKLEPAGTWHRPAIHSVRLARNGMVLDPAAIERIDLYTRPLVSDNMQNTDLQTSMDTQASYPYLLAVEACGIPLAQWSQAAIFENPEIQRLVKNVTIHDNPEADAELRRDLETPPYRARGVKAKAEIVMKDGRVLEGMSKYGDGDPFDEGTRVTFEKLDVKFDAFAAPILGSEAREAARTALSQGSMSVRELVRALCTKSGG
jgi:2-methylcitrate dehydratase PrpD